MNSIRVQVIETITSRASEDGASPMVTFSTGMLAMSVLSIYEEKMREKYGDLNTLFTALENGGFTDDHGTNLTDTITYRNLKKLCGETEDNTAQ